MKINGSRDGLRPDALSGGQPARPTAPAPAAAPSDEARVPDLSGALGQLATRLAAEGQFDQARVDEIKDAIAKGEYEVDADAVADKLVQAVRDLLAGKA